MLYAIIAEDVPGSLEKRLANRPAHLERLKALQDAGHEVLLDDRNERPGVKFKDADLIGVPMQLVIGGKGLARNIIETKDRRTSTKGELPWPGNASEFMASFTAWRKEVYAGWGLEE